MSPGYLHSAYDIAIRSPIFNVLEKIDVDEAAFEECSLLLNFINTAGNLE